jgi:PAS domain S-box-containing protein
MTDLGMTAKLQAAFELSPTSLAVTDLSDGRIVEVNDAFLRALGYAREEIIGRPISDIRLWVDPGLREKGLVALRVGQPVRDMEARFRTKSGAEIVAIANATGRRRWPATSRTASRASSRVTERAVQG